MKKICFMLVLSLFFIMMNVNAETYYGEYYRVDEINEESVMDDEVLIKETILYNTYEEIYTDLGYLEDNEEYIKDEEDFIEEYVVSDDYEDSEEQYISIGTDIKSFSEILFRNIPINTQLSELEFYYNDEVLEYKCYLNHVKDIKKLLDGDMDTYMTSLSNSSLLRLLVDNNPLTKNFKVILYAPQPIDIKVNVTFTGDEKYQINLKGKKYIITFDNETDDIKYTYGSNVKKYRYYRKDRILTNNYVENGENLIIDDYIINNEYFVRDKLVLKDEITINNIKWRILL